MSTPKTHYIPGVCNINPTEIRRRRMLGHIGLAVTILLATALLALHASSFVRFLVVVPAFMAATGYLQAHNKFCVGLASSGRQHADDGKIVSIKDNAALKADALKTNTMNLQAGAIALVVAMLVALIPVS